MKPEIDKNKIVIFSGAGISAESGLQTFRDSDGLWNEHAVEDVATPEGWSADPKLVLNFYNERRIQAFQASPNAAHKAIAKLEEKFEVVVITQNIDDLHEKAGSTNVVHVHGQLKFARSSLDDRLLYPLEDKPIHIGDVCEKGSQLRPHVVWFGEQIHNYEIARDHIITASRVLVVGTSLSVFPAAGILKKARFHAEKIIVTLNLEKKPHGFKLLRGKATALVPSIINNWLNV
ncbi:MAG: NAD-dependent deacylase [Oleispira sp.]|nr:NAD-dependent deacylase [Oleispira sp.]MBL4881905.1 NAD-dependent deacylase [Oleispira sp.]